MTMFLFIDSMYAPALSLTLSQLYLILMMISLKTLKIVRNRNISYMHMHISHKHERSVQNCDWIANSGVFLWLNTSFKVHGAQMTEM
jgi:hypothetical protein